MVNGQRWLHSISYLILFYWQEKRKSNRSFTTKKTLSLLLQSSDGSLTDLTECVFLRMSFFLRVAFKLYSIRFVELF